MTGVQTCALPIFPETDLEFETKLIEPNIDITNIFDNKKEKDLKRTLLNFLNFNLASSNYDKGSLRVMQSFVNVISSLLSDMKRTDLDLSASCNFFTIKLQSLATLFKGYNGWITLMHNSQFSEAKVFEFAASNTEEEIDENKKHFNLPLFTKARSGSKIIQPSSRNALKTL